MRLLSATTIALMTVTVKDVVVAQSVTATFDVASIRPVADGQQSSPVIRITERGQLVGGATLKNIILLAYGAEPYERAVPADLAVSRSLEERFEIAALPPESSPPPNREEVKAMTRKLLTDRFGLKLRIDSELVSAVVLRVVKPGVLGPAIRPAPEGCAQLPPEARIDEAFAEALRRSCRLTMFGRVRGTVTLDNFARVLSVRAGRPILNRTNLEGLFTIDVTFDTTSLQDAPSRLGARVPGPPDQGDAPAFVDALRNQMGLSARPERQPVRLFVVERVGPLVEN